MPLTAGVGPVNRGDWWNPIDDVKAAAGAVAGAAKGAFNLGKDVLGAIGDAAKWVYDTASNVFRIGAADALSGLFKVPEAAMDLASKGFGGPGQMFDKGVHAILDDVVSWVRGKEAPDPSAGGADC